MGSISSSGLGIRIRTSLCCCPVWIWTSLRGCSSSDSSIRIHLLLLSIPTRIILIRIRIHPSRTQIPLLLPPTITIPLIPRPRIRTMRQQSHFLLFIPRRQFLQFHVLFGFSVLDSSARSRIPRRHSRQAILMDFPPRRIERRCARHPSSSHAPSRTIITRIHRHRSLILSPKRRRRSLLISPSPMIMRFMISRRRTTSITARAHPTAALHSAAETADTAPDEGEGDQRAEDYGGYDGPFTTQIVFALVFFLGEVVVEGWGMRRDGGMGRVYIPICFTHTTIP